MRQEQHTSGGPAAARDEIADVAVLGAGLAGLTAAAVAAARGARVVLVDPHTPGGRAATTTVDPGVIFNRGPRALYRGGAGIGVLASLGIEFRGATPPQEGHGVMGGQVHPLPNTAGLMLRSKMLGVVSKARLGRLLGTVSRIDASRYDDWTLERWLDHHRLAPDARGLVLGVIRTATYVADTRTFSAGAAIHQLQMALDENVLYLDGGWQQLVDALGQQLRDRGGVLRGERASRIERDTRPGATGWVVHTDASQLRATSVVVATGGPDAAASLLPVELDRSGLGEPATAACLELALDRPPTHRFLLGLDEPLYLSVHSDAAKLGPEGLHVAHVMRYGARTSDEDRRQLWAHAAAAGIEQDHVVASRFLHRMVVTGGIPVAASGGLAGRPTVQVPGCEGLLLAGDWVGGVGMLGDAAMASGEHAGRLAASRAGRPGAEDRRRVVLAG